jgi:hypothetical protein
MITANVQLTLVILKQDVNINPLFVMMITLAPLTDVWTILVVIISSSPVMITVPVPLILVMKMMDVKI